MREFVGMSPHNTAAASPLPPQDEFAGTATAAKNELAGSAFAEDTEIADTTLTMQNALLTLTQYWTNHGCLVVQPMNTEVGAGTGNPATALRVLGPEPWRVAYVEPSVRPDDARYGYNPNRLQTHTQFQVILKPDPGNSQELYLGSLAALGIDTSVHDVRFVEDNWASPALGAWGLGWEVWLNGLEITQFTYFQQAGGVTLDPVSVEITYGIERIMMALQNVSHFKQISYAPGISYDEVFGQAEYEWSRYYLDEADVDSVRKQFDVFAAEARAMIEQRLPVPAYSYVLKCSHTFNVLDSRGAISTTQRAKAFAQMRGLTHDVAQLWTARREEEKYPLGRSPAAPLATAQPDGIAPSEPAALVFEIGLEEMPSREVTKTANAVREALTEKLAATKLEHGPIATFATPRRVVAIVQDVAPVEPDSEQTVRGPRLSAAFDANGNPTKAAAGFARGQGVEVAELERITVDGVEHVGLVKHVAGRTATQVLSEVLPSVVSGLRSDKNMRWNAPGLTFTRPIRWIVALLGGAVVPFAVSNLASGRTTYVHRNAANPEIILTHADSYLETLAQHNIVVSADSRKNEIVRVANELAASVGGAIDSQGENALVDEVTNLVEFPQPLLGAFDPEYLQLPGEILTTVMRKHQRYLPVRDAAGHLLPHFIAVANGPRNTTAQNVVRAGNEAVLRARYEDAAFFYRADSERKPAEFIAELDKLTFADGLGTMADRARRIEHVSATFANIVDLTGPDLSVLARAGELAKFDIGTQMVIELSSLAGTMAREYARRAGEPEDVATALYEMELPRSTSDALPTTTPGALLALADRFDLLAGLFALGAAPTGSSDPFGMRRAALGVVAILRAHPELTALTIHQGLRSAAARQPVDVSEEALAAAHEFVVRRAEQSLLDAGEPHNFVNAVAPVMDSPLAADATLAELHKRESDERFTALAAALQRVRRIVPDGTLASYDPSALVEPAELALHDAYTAVRSTLSDQRSSLAEFINAAQPLVKPTEQFFNDVLVMAEDPHLRAARLGLLASITQLSTPVLDWSTL